MPAASCYGNLRYMVAVNQLAEPRSVPGMSLAELRDLSLYRVMRSLPVSAVSRIGAGLGQILGRRAHPAADARVVAALRHLRSDLALEPSTLEAAQTRLWANVGRVYAEFCVLHKIVPQGRATIDDPGTFEAVLADGRPVIVPFVHLGNWETMPIQIIHRVAPGRFGGLANPLPSNRVRAQVAAMQRGRLGADVMTIDGNVWRRAVQHLEQRAGILFVASDEQAEDHVSTPSCGRALDSRGNLGKIVRINPDGSVPEDNPFVGQIDAKPEIWSYGHRNPQGVAIHPETGKLWESEFGPMGGDELNIPAAGANYGWPVVSWGKHYDGRAIPAPPTHPEFADAVDHWNPVISPSGITFYTSDAIPAWKGNLLIAGLSSEAIIRLTLDGETVTGEERIPMGTRIRDVVQGPDGAVYALTDEDDGKILRLSLESPHG